MSEQKTTVRGQYNDGGDFKQAPDPFWRYNITLNKSDGTWEVYDREKKTTSTLSGDRAKFNFMFLDSANSVGGFTKDGSVVDLSKYPKGLGIYSTYFKKSKDPVSAVFLSNGKKQEAWSGKPWIPDLKAIKGLAFTANLFVVLKNGSLARITLDGRPMGVWTTFKSGDRNDKSIKGHWKEISTDYAVQIDGWGEYESFGNTYKYPIFSIKKATEKVLAAADDAWTNKVKPYFEEYFDAATAASASNNGGNGAAPSSGDNHAKDLFIRKASEITDLGDLRVQWANTCGAIDDAGLSSSDVDEVFAAWQAAADVICDGADRDPVELKLDGSFEDMPF